MESSLYFIIHHAPRSSQIKLDLLSSPARSGSKPCEICWRILITLCIPRKSKSNTHTHMQTCTDFLWLHYSSNESSVSPISPEFIAKVKPIGVTPAPPKGTRENNSFWRFLLSCFFFFLCEIQTYSSENQIKNASPWHSVTLFIYLNEHKHRHTGAWRNTYFMLRIGIVAVQHN